MIYRKLNYDEASEFCFFNQSILANIPSHQINYFLYEMIYLSYKKRFRQAPIEFWIGLNDR